MRMRIVSNKKIFGLTTSTTEIQDILRAWGAISLAFAILLGRDHLLSVPFFTDLLFAAISVGLGFLLHEIAHKVVAIRYGCVAEFRAYNQMLLIMILLSFFGWIIAAPGAVLIEGPVGVKRNGKISAAGPATNIVLAVIFLGLSTITTGFWRNLGLYGFMINGWLALFNLLPIWNFDGKKILEWSKFSYISLVVISLILVFSRPLSGAFS